MNLAMVRQGGQTIFTQPLGEWEESTARAEESYVAFMVPDTGSSIVGLVVHSVPSLWVPEGVPGEDPALQENWGMESGDKPISLSWGWGFKGVGVSKAFISWDSTRIDARVPNIWWNSIFWRQLETKLSILRPLPRDSILQISRRIRQLAKTKMLETQGSGFGAGYDEMLRPESVEGFCRFLARINRPKTPELSVTNSGNIYARWRESSSRKLSLEFLSAKQTKFILFSPSQSQTGAIRYNKGLEDVDAILDVLSPYRITELLT